MQELRGKYLQHGCVLSNFEGELRSTNLPDNMRTFLIQCWRPFKDIIEDVLYMRKIANHSSIDGLGSSVATINEDDIEGTKSSFEVVGDNVFKNEINQQRITSLLRVDLNGSMS